MPWFPLPELTTTGSTQPLILASLLAAGALLPAVHQGAAHAHAVVVPQPLLGNGQIAGHLLFQDGLQLLQGRGPGKFIDLCHRHLLPPPLGSLHGGTLAAKQDLAVPLLPDNVGMGVHDLHQGGVALPLHLHNDMEVGAAQQGFYLAQSGSPQGTDPLHIRRLYRAEYLHLPLRVSRQGAQQGADVDPPQVAGGGNNDPLHIFDDIAAA